MCDERFFPLLISFRRTPVMHYHYRPLQDQWKSVKFLLTVCSHFPPSPPLMCSPTAPLLLLLHHNNGRVEECGFCPFSGPGCKFQCSPRAPDRRGDWAPSAPTSSWSSGGLQGNEDWAAGARQGGDTESVCVCMCVRFFGISSQTWGRGFQGLHSSSPLVTTGLIIQHVTHTFTHTHTHTHKTKKQLLKHTTVSNINFYKYSICS